MHLRRISFYPIYLLLFLIFSIDACQNFKESSGKKARSSVNWNKIADQSSDALIDQYWNSKFDYFNTDNQGDTLFQYWPQAHALDVLVVEYNRSHNKKYEQYIRKWYKGVKKQTKGTFINEYYDDMEWNALAMLRAYKATGNSKFKMTVDSVWKNIKTGWTEFGGGGIKWRKHNSDSKNACSNGPASILASDLYQINHNPENLKWAKKIYHWEKSTLVDSATGAVWDNIAFKGCGLSVKKSWKFTYNQGTFVGAGVKLYELTKQPQYLHDAIKTADFTIDSLTTKKNHLLKDEGNGDAGLFKGIFVRYLTKLIHIPDLPQNKREQYISFLVHNAHILWSNGTNRNVLFGTNWNVKPGNKVGLKTDLSGVILMESMASLAKMNQRF